MGYSAPLTASTKGLFGGPSVPTWRRIGGAVPFGTASVKGADGLATRLSPFCFSDARQAALCWGHDLGKVLAYPGDIGLAADRNGLYFVADVLEEFAAEYERIASGEIHSLSPHVCWQPWHASKGRDGVLDINRASLLEISAVEQGNFRTAGIIPVDASWDDDQVWRTLKALPGQRASGMAALRRSIASNQVDHEARIIRGMVLAEQGPLKSKRGEFDAAGIEAVAKLVNVFGGVESYYTHDHVFDSNKVPILLGMVTNARVDRSHKPARVRGDLTFFPSASIVPGLGDLAGYVMQRADERPEAISSSLVFYADLEHRPPVKRGRDFVQQPPLLRPTQVLSSDIVGEGDAVSSLLSRSGRLLNASFDPLADRRAQMRRRAMLNRSWMARSY